MISNIRFLKDITRIDMPLSEVRVWAEGESAALEELFGFSFSNHLFVSKNKSVTLYCDSEECDEFYSVLEEKLTSPFFNEVCGIYFSLIEETENLEGENLRGVLVKLWPILTIFQEVSQYPELVNDHDLRRLIRIRKTTEASVYDLFHMLESEEEPSEYYFFQGKLYPQELNLDEITVVG